MFNRKSFEINDFLNYFTGSKPKKFNYSFNKPQTSPENETLRTMKVEVLSYLSAPSPADENDLSQFKDYPNIRRVFAKFNTLLTSLAPVEQFFSSNSK